MRKLGLRLIVPALLILALASCIGGGGSSDNPAAGVEPGDQLQSQDSGELLINDNFNLPTENATDDNDDIELDLTGTPDVNDALFGSDNGSDDALFGGESGSSALDGGSGESSTGLFDEATPTVTPGA